MPQAPDKWGIVNVSSKRQVECLPVDDNDDSDKDGSGPPSDEEEDVVDMPLSKAHARSTSTKHGCHGGTSNMPTQWALIGKLDAYRDKGASQPTKHLWAIHDGYHWWIHQHIGLCVDTRVNVRPLKVPEPWAYGSEEDIEAFEGWLGNILRWFSINRYCGPDFDRDHVVCTVMFLEDATLICYGDNINGGSH